MGLSKGNSAPFDIRLCYTPVFYYSVLPFLHPCPWCLFCRLSYDEMKDGQLNPGFLAFSFPVPFQPYGQEVQRYLLGADAEHHALCMPPHLLQQHGKIGNESKDAPVPDGA